ncbi:hypothetical protein KTI62_13425 [Acinetobacter schindleri]|uniref:hypothetical protein n=1 Tax=Acinetobacter schindleri TaxID=108981 RepID=UPI0021CD712D|nr:hypothetical protein [Acinetobacter schindleri]MCU4521158.1 hypothetical protein [Acinetobacter schindleri]
MDISEKQAVWREQKPLFEAEFIHSHLLPFFNFNENTGDYEIKSECVNNTDDEDRKVAYETLNTGWVMWLRAKRDVKAQAVPEGFVLVPKEPTEAMIQRGTKANSECLNENAPLGERLFRHPALQVYQAMVNGSGE